MRKIFSILVVLMMVAGTFVSCNMPTNDSTGAVTSTSGRIIAEGSDKNLCIVRDDDGKIYLCSKAVANSEGFVTSNLSRDIPNDPRYGWSFKKIYITPKEDECWYNPIWNTDGSLKIEVLGAASSSGALEYSGYTLHYKIN